jgi:CubicO group peptidase (beta-lactamase class C family)
MPQLSSSSARRPSNTTWPRSSTSSASPHASNSLASRSATHSFQPTSRARRALGRRRSPGRAQPRRPATAGPGLGRARRRAGALASGLLPGRLHVDTEPATKRANSNHGFTALGQIVEDVTGIPFRRYLRAHVFGPFGIHHSDLLRSEQVAVRHGHPVIRGQIPVLAIRRALRLHPDGGDP